MTKTRRRTNFVLPLLVIGTVAASTIAAAGPPEWTATGTDQHITIDGRLDEPAWDLASPLPDLIQQDPYPGEPTPYRTVVRVLVDKDTLYLGIVCYDPDPTRIAIHSMQRDGTLRGDDTIALVLDTDGDRRRGYFFMVNAAGARLDGLISGPGEMSTDWDGIWDAGAQRNNVGWTVEIEIPAQSLRFHWGLDRWGFNLERKIARDRTVLRLTAATLDAGIFDLQRAGVLRGVARLRQGMGLSLSPYGLLGLTQDLENDVRSTEDEIGGDLTWNISAGLTGILTVNTDFAETEVDTRQINLTRFPLFFPEKRSFFLEGSELFSFGIGLGRDFIPFFSRRIGLFEGEEVPIIAGAKLLGRSGRWSIAALDVVTDQTDVTERSNLFTGRITYDVTEKLTVGALATDGDPEGVRDNSLLGIDATWRTSEFRGDKNLAIGGWATWSAGDLPEGRASGWGFKLDYPNDLWDLYLIAKEFGDALDPALGFLPRPGTRWYQVGGAYQPRPEGGAFDWVRQFFFEGRVNYIEDLDGQVESWRIFTAPFNAVTESGEHIEANAVPMFEHLDEPFEIAEGVVIPPGDYQFNRFRVEAQSSRHRPWRVGATVWFGDFYTGSLTQASAFVSYTTPSGHLQLQLSGENNVGTMPEGDFTENLGLLKLVYAFTPDLILSSFAQYDSESRDLGVNTRLRWTLRPGNDLFVVWNHGWRHPLSSRGGTSLIPVDDSLVAKLRWTFRW
ncbi:MAG: DUF5916 domain-containing protein [Thermoanaerobaculales bacterium]